MYIILIMDIENFHTIILGVLVWEIGLLCLWHEQVEETGDWKGKLWKLEQHYLRLFSGNLINDPVTWNNVFDEDVSKNNVREIRNKDRLLLIKKRKKGNKINVLQVLKESLIEWYDWE